jgi:hypothetical protein
MIVAGRGSVKRGSSALPEDRAQDEECHDGHFLAFLPMGRKFSE